MYHFLALSGGYGGNSFYNSYGSNNPVPWPLLWWSLRNRATYLLVWLTLHLPFVLLYQLSYEHTPFLILFEIISFVIYAATYKTIHDGMVFRSIVAFGNIFFFSLICYYHNFYFHFRCIYVLHLLLLHVSLLVYVSAFRSECYFYSRITCGTQTHLHNVTVFSLCHF